VAGYSGLNGDFVWDDVSLLIIKPVYRNFDLKTIFLSPANGVEYLPIRDISYIIDMKLWGIMNPYGFHLTNLILYCLTAITVFLVSREIFTLQSNTRDKALSGTFEDTAALLAALMFVVHPIHSEVVAFVTQRNTLLSSLFFFLSLWCYLRHSEGNKAYSCWYVVSVFTFLLSLMSKGYGIILPLVLLLCVAIFAKRGKSGLRCFQELVPFVLVSILFFILYTTVARSAQIMIFQSGNQSFIGKIAIALQIPFFYAGKLLYPVSLAPEYDFFYIEPSLISFRVVMCCIILVFSGAVAFKWRNKFPLLLFCYGWFLLTLLPVLNLFPTNPNLADRYAFIPSFAPCLLAASIFPVITKRRSRILYLTACAVGISGFLYLMIAQNEIWRSGVDLWSHAVKVSPRSYVAYMNLSRALKDRGDMGEAIKMAQQALTIDPRSCQFDYLMGIQFLMNDNYPDAINAFSRSIDRDSFFLEGYYQLAKTYERIGRFSEAANTYRRLLASPGFDLDGYRDKATNGLVQLRENGVNY
jgi:hypothetical protein